MSAAVNREGYVVAAFWSSKEAEFPEGQVERRAFAVTGSNSSVLTR